MIGVENNKPLAAEVLNNELVKLELNARTASPTSRSSALEHPLSAGRGKNADLRADRPGSAVRRPAASMSRVMVLNVSTVRFIDKYLKTGMPLVEKTPDARWQRRENALQRQCTDRRHDPGCHRGSRRYASDAGKVIMGGSMMGVALDRIGYIDPEEEQCHPRLRQGEAKIPQETQCIRCGRCVEACPMHLMPTLLDIMARNKDVEALNDFFIMDCIECGCCTYVCPAKRYLVQSIRNGKGLCPSRQDEGGRQMMLQVSSSPHIRDSVTTRRLMLDVMIALIPSLIASIYIFGYRVLIVTL